MGKVFIKEKINYLLERNQSTKSLHMSEIFYFLNFQYFTLTETETPGNLFLRFLVM